jgi:hypothetical protein
LRQTAIPQKADLFATTCLWAALRTAFDVGLPPAAAGKGCRGAVCDEPRRRLAGSRPRPLPPRAANHVWAYDFVFDYCANGQQLKCLTVVDEFTHECLAIDVAGSIRSGRVIDVLTRLMSAHGAPAYLRSRQRSGVRKPRHPAMAHRCAH